MALCIKHKNGGITWIPRSSIELLSDTKLICELGSFLGSYERDEDKEVFYAEGELEENSPCPF